MSEKQARQKRKNEPQKEVKKQKGSIWVNVVATVVVLAFLGLGGYALKDNLKALIPEKPEKEQTVADLAKDRDMSFEGFIEEFGLDAEEVNKDTTESEVISKLTVENYAKFSDKTTEELLEEYGIEGVEGNMLWQDAYQYMPMSKYAETMGSTFDEFKSQAGLPDEITEDMTLKDAGEIMQRIQEEAAAAAEAEEAESEETEESEESEEEAAETEESEEEAEAEEAAE